MDKKLRRKLAESRASEYLLEQELKRLEKSKTKNYVNTVDNYIEELLKRYPSLNLNKFSQLLHQQQRSHFIQQYSEEQIKELIDSYFNNKNRKKSKR